MMDLASRLLYRDASVLVVDKPYGLAVHAGGKSPGPHLGELLPQLAFGLPQPPELAHRLDRDTSGCLVLGRHRQALRRLGALFAQGAVDKIYWAVTVGVPDGDSGVIDKPLAKIESHRGGGMRVDERGQPSVTEWRVLGRTERLAWLECRPLTGRTHQIRVHCAAMGCPIVGDDRYGRGTATLEAPELHLLARRVTLPFAPKKPPISVTAPVPAHMAERLSRCGWDGS